MRRFSSGRDSFEPDTPSSTYSPTISHPRRDAYSRSSANCISGCWPFRVDTLAYSATRIILLISFLLGIHDAFVNTLGPVAHVEAQRDRSALLVSPAVGIGETFPPQLTFWGVPKSLHAFRISLRVNCLVHRTAHPTSTAIRQVDQLHFGMWIFRVA